MVGEYEIQARETVIKDLLADEWREVPAVAIANYPWGCHYKPHAEVRMYYTKTGFHLLFLAYEQEIKARYVEMNDPVYKDSCMEIFFNPNPTQDPRYMNFEINPFGVMLIGISKSREEHTRLTPGAEKELKIQALLNRDTISQYQGDYWTVGLNIPFQFLEKYYGKIAFQSGWEMRGNFYKCGDDTRYPHYGCWNWIGSENPDFHRPEYFGTIKLL